MMQYYTKQKISRVTKVCLPFEHAIIWLSPKTLQFLAARMLTMVKLGEEKYFFFYCFFYDKE